MDGAMYRSDAGTLPAKEGAMIFRQFLVPKTGCASHLFG
jgi:hypothetical protein